MSTMKTVPTKPRLAISCWLTGRPLLVGAVADSRSNCGAWNGSSWASSGRFAVQSSTASPMAAKPTSWARVASAMPGVRNVTCSRPSS